MCPWRFSPKDPLKLLSVKAVLLKGSLPQLSGGLGFPASHTVRLWGSLWQNPWSGT